MLTPELAVIHDEMFPLYLIRGERNLLVDTAITARSDQIGRNLDQLLAGEPLHAVVLTHSHYDHTGALTFLEERYGCEIFSSQRTKEILENPKSIEFINKLNREFDRLLDCPHGAEVRIPKKISAVREGDIIPVARDRWLQVYETPGHTRCSISFLLLPERIFFVGDAAGILERKGRHKPLFLSSYLQYERSLSTIASVNAEMLGLPHNTPIRGARNVADYLAGARASMVHAKEDILAALRQSRDFEHIAAEILAREFPHPTIIGPREAFLINLTVMIKAVFREYVETAPKP